MYEQEQNGKAAECERKCIDLCNKHNELKDLYRQRVEWHYNAFYMQQASLQNDIAKKEAECFWTWNELCEKFTELDARHRQAVLQHCCGYAMTSCLLNSY